MHRKAIQPDPKPTANIRRPNLKRVSCRPPQPMTNVRELERLETRRNTASKMVVSAPTLQCGPRLLVIAVALTALCNADTSSSSMCRCDIPCRRNSEVTQSVLSDGWALQGLLMNVELIVTALPLWQTEQIARRRIARQMCTLLFHTDPIIEIMSVSAKGIWPMIHRDSHCMWQLYCTVSLLC
jgi:hypothetical protein